MLFSNGKPQMKSKADQIKQLLLRQYAQSFGDESKKLPSETTLAEQFEVSRSTLRDALQALEDEGYIERKRGAGTYWVKRPTTSVLSAPITHLLPSLETMGMQTDISLLSFGLEKAAADICKLMDLTEREIQRAVRVRSHEGVPFSYLETYVAPPWHNQITGFELAERPLYQLLEEAGATLGSAEQWVSATVANHELAKSLDCQLGDPLLYLERLTRSDSGQPVELLRAHYHPQRYRLEMRLERTSDNGEKIWR